MQSSPPEAVDTSEEINLRDYWRILVKRRAMIISIICGLTLGPAIVTLFLLNVYQSKAVLLPLSNSQGNSQQAALLGGLFGVAQETPTTRLLKILQSRTLAEAVVHHLDLAHILFADAWDADKQQWLTDPPPTLEDVVLALQGNMSITPDDTETTVTITANSSDPVLASAIVNQHIEALRQVLNENAFSLAKKNRIFIEAQVQKTRVALVMAEEALQRFGQDTKVVALDAQTTATVQAIATIEGDIMAKEVRLKVLQSSMTGATQEVYLLHQELQALRTQLARLQQGSQLLLSAAVESSQENATLLSLDKVPDLQLHYVRLRRNVEIQNELFKLLMQQLEQAKIEEARDETAFQVIDRAVPSNKKIAPRRAIIVIVATMVAALGSVFFAFVRESMDMTVRTAEQIIRLPGLSLLATIPTTANRKRRLARRSRQSLPLDLVLHQTPDSPVREAFRYLHRRMRHLSTSHRMKSLLFVGVGGDVGTTTVIANLALVAASLGERTLVVDTNLRSPLLHSLFHCAMTPGLAEAIGDVEAWHTCVYSTGVDNLSLVPGGTITPITSAYLELPLFDTLLERWTEHYDLVLCSASSPSECVDAVVLGDKMDATCLVFTSGVSHLESAIEARSALEAVGARIVGAILIGDTHV